jgi:ribosomal protein S5
VLQLAGIKDIWTKAEGRTNNRFSTSMAVVNAIDELNKMRVKQPWS